MLVPNTQGRGKEYAAMRFESSYRFEKSAWASAQLLTCFGDNGISCYGNFGDFGVVTRFPLVKVRSAWHGWNFDVQCYSFIRDHILIRYCVSLDFIPFLSYAIDRRALAPKRSLSGSGYSWPQARYNSSCACKPARSSWYCSSTQRAKKALWEQVLFLIRAGLYQSATKGIQSDSQGERAVQEAQCLVQILITSVQSADPKISKNLS